MNRLGVSRLNGGGLVSCGLCYCRVDITGQGSVPHIGVWERFG